MAERSKHQQKVIKRFYDNREAISLQRAQELVTELYLAEGKSRVTHWKNIAKHLSTLGVDKKTIDHLISEDKPELVVTLLEKVMSKQD